MKPKVGIEIEAFITVQNKFGLRLVARKEIAWRKHLVRIAIDAIGLGGKITQLCAAYLVAV